MRIHELSDDNVSLTSSLKSNAQNQNQQNSQAQHYQTLLRTMAAQAESLRGANELLEQKLLEMSNRLEDIKDQSDEALVKELEDRVLFSEKYFTLWLLIYSFRSLNNRTL